MINLDKIAEELFNKIRGRYPKITLGDESSTITNVPTNARFFDFEYTKGNKVNVTIDEKSLTVLYSNNLLSDSTIKKEDWYGFMKELRQFAKKRMLNFDTRDITKTNLDRRDYEYMSKNRPGEETMSESKMYGTSKTSFQDLGNARIVVKHRGAVNQENAAGRTQQIDSIYIESSEGERFKYPYRHLNGARAMARHVSEGGNAYDTFGKHIVSLSEELNKLRQFKTYMNRSSVMAEGLAGYMDVVNERIDGVKDTIFKLQRETYYKEAFDTFEETVMEEVPTDVSSNWIDELTIRQFNEELKGVFPYIYKLVSEANKTKELGPEDLLGETSEVTVEAQMDADALKAWYSKYEDKQSWDAYSLGNGFFKWKLDSGIATDSMERSEVEALIKKFGEEEVMDDPFAAMEKAPELAPITTAMHDEFSQIVGKKYPDEEDFEKASNIIQDIDEDMKPADLLGEEALDFSDKNKELSMWLAKYDNYLGKNGDPLPLGWIESMTNTGIISDGAEQDEIVAFEKKIGKEESEWEDTDWDEFNKPENSPITNKMFADLAKIIGTDDHDEDVARAVSDALSIGEGLNMEDEFASHMDSIVANSKHEQGPKQNEGSVPNYLDREWKDNLAACAKGEEGGEDAVCDMLDKFDIPKDKAADLIQKQIDKKTKGIGVMFRNPLKAEPEWDNLQKLVDRLKGKSMDEGNEFAQKVRGLKAKGAKPGTKFKTSDGEEHTLEDAIRLAGLQVEDFWSAEELMAEKEPTDDDTMDVKIGPDGSISKADKDDAEDAERAKEKQELPLDEFIKGHFDYTTNQFPKGETAVMTAVEKKYGDDAVTPATQIMQELVNGQDEEMARIKTLAGMGN